MYLSSVHVHQYMYNDVLSVPCRWFSVVSVPFWTLFWPPLFPVSVVTVLFSPPLLLFLLQSFPPPLSSSFPDGYMTVISYYKHDYYMYLFFFPCFLFQSFFFCSFLSLFLVAFQFFIFLYPWITSICIIYSMYSYNV